jgi:hypothetical protein
VNASTTTEVLTTGIEVVVSSTFLVTEVFTVGIELPPVTITELIPARPARAETDFGFTGFFFGALWRPALCLPADCLPVEELLIGTPFRQLAWKNPYFLTLFYLKICQFGNQTVMSGVFMT